MSDKPMLFPDGSTHNIPSSNIDRARNDFGAIPFSTSNTSPRVLFPDGSIARVPIANLGAMSSEYGGRLITGREKFSVSLGDGSVLNDVPVKNLQSAVEKYGADISGLFPKPEALAAEIQPQVSEDPIFKSWIGRPLEASQLASLDGGKEYIELAEKAGEKAGFFESLFDFTKEDIPFFIGGGVTASRLHKISNISERLTEGREVSDQELLDLNRFLAESEREANASWLGKAGSIIRQSIVFGSEFLASLAVLGPLGAGAGVAGGRRFLQSVAKDKVGAAVRESIEKVAGAGALAKAGGLAAEIGTFTGIGGGLGTGIATAAQLAATGGEATSNMARNKIYEELLGEPDSSYAKNLLSGTAVEFIERSTEFAGPYLMLPFSKLLNKVKPTRAMGKLLRETLDNAVARSGRGATTAEGAARLTALGAFLANQTAKYGITQQAALRMLKNVGYDGVLEEMSEERLADFMHGLLGTDGSEGGLRNAFESVIPDAEQFKAELLAFSFPMLYTTGVEKLAQSKFLGGGGISRVREVVEGAAKAWSSPDSFLELKDSESAKAVVEAAANMQAAIGENLEGSKITQWAATILTLPFHMDIHRAQYGTLSKALMANGIEYGPAAFKQAYNAVLKSKNIEPGSETDTQKAEATKEARNAMVAMINRDRRVVLQANTVSDLQRFEALKNAGELKRQDLPLKGFDGFNNFMRYISVDSKALAHMSEEDKLNLLSQGVELPAFTAEEMFDKYLGGQDALAGSLGPGMMIPLSAFKSVLSGTSRDKELEARVFLSLFNANPMEGVSWKAARTRAKYLTELLNRSSANPTRWFSGDTIIKTSSNEEYLYLDEDRSNPENIMVLNKRHANDPSMVTTLSRSDFNAEKINQVVHIMPRMLAEDTRENWEKFLVERARKMDRAATPEEKENLNRLIGGITVSELLNDSKTRLRADTILTRNSFARKAPGGTALQEILLLGPGALSFGNGTVSLMVGRKATGALEYHALEDLQEDLRKKRNGGQSLPNDFERQVMQDILDFLKRKASSLEEGTPERQKHDEFIGLLTNEDGTLNGQQAFEFYGKIYNQKILGYDSRRYKDIETLFFSDLIALVPDKLDQVRAGMEAEMKADMDTMLGAGHETALFNPFAPEDLAEEEGEAPEAGQQRPSEPDAGAPAPAARLSQERRREIVEQVLDGVITDANRNQLTAEEAAFIGTPQFISLAKSIIREREGAGGTIKEQLDKAFPQQDIELQEEEHVYVVGGEQRESVTTRIMDAPKFKFDQQAKAEEIAKRDGRTAQEVIDEWEQDRLVGNEFHQRMSDVLTGKSEPKNEAERKLRDALQARGEVFSEFKVWTDKLAGTIDVIVVRPDGSLELYDFKTKNYNMHTSKFYDRDAKAKNLDSETQAEAHRLQLLAYRRILGSKGFRVSGMYIVPIIRPDTLAENPNKDSVVIDAKPGPRTEKNYSEVFKGVAPAPGKPILEAPDLGAAAPKKRPAKGKKPAKEPTSATALLLRPSSDIISELKNIDGTTIEELAKKYGYDSVDDALTKVKNTEFRKELVALQEARLEELRKQGIIEPFVLSDGISRNFVRVNQRVMVKIKVGNTVVPFWISTGLGGKTLKTDVFYPFFGTQRDKKKGGVLWLNKTDSKDLANYYGRPVLKKAAAILNGGLLSTDQLAFAVTALGSTASEAVEAGAPDGQEEAANEVADQLSKLWSFSSPAASSKDKEQFVKHASAVLNRIDAEVARLSGGKKVAEPEVEIKLTKKQQAEVKKGRLLVFKTQAAAKKDGLAPGETGVVTIDGQKFKLKYVGPKKVSEVPGGAKFVLEQEGVEKVSELKTKYLQAWVRGKGRLAIYQLSAAEKPKEEKKKPAPKKKEEAAKKPAPKKLSEQKPASLKKEGPTYKEPLTESEAFNEIKKAAATPFMVSGTRGETIFLVTPNGSVAVITEIKGSKRVLRLTPAGLQSLGLAPDAEQQVLDVVVAQAGEAPVASRGQVIALMRYFLADKDEMTDFELGDLVNDGQREFGTIHEDLMEFVDPGLFLTEEDEDAAVRRQKLTELGEAIREVLEDGVVAPKAVPATRPSAEELQAEIRKDFPELADLDLREETTGIQLFNIAVSEQKKGVGRKVMKRITDFADKYGVRIYLEAATRERSLSQDKLEDFYKSVGFTQFTPEDFKDQPVPPPFFEYIPAAAPKAAARTKLTPKEEALLAERDKQVSEAKKEQADKILEVAKSNLDLAKKARPDDAGLIATLEKKVSDAEAPAKKSKAKKKETDEDIMKSLGVKPKKERRDPRKGGPTASLMHTEATAALDLVVAMKHKAYLGLRTQDPTLSVGRADQIINRNIRRLYYDMRGRPPTIEEANISLRNFSGWLRAYPEDQARVDSLIRQINTQPSLMLGVQEQIDRLQRGTRIGDIPTASLQDFVAKYAEVPMERLEANALGKLSDIELSDEEKDLINKILEAASQLGISGELFALENITLPEFVLGIQQATMAAQRQEQLESEAEESKVIASESVPVDRRRGSGAALLENLNVSVVTPGFAPELGPGKIFGFSGGQAGGDLTGHAALNKTFPVYHWLAATSESVNSPKKQGHFLDSGLNDSLIQGIPAEQLLVLNTDEELVAAAKRAGISVDTSSFGWRLTARDALQVMSPQVSQVFAVIPELNGVLVPGGTRHAVRSATAAGKEVFVFEEKSGKWHRMAMKGNAAVAKEEVADEDVVIVDNFAVVGSRKVTAKSQRALEELGQRSIGSVRKVQVSAPISGKLASNKKVPIKVQARNEKGYIEERGYEVEYSEGYGTYRFFVYQPEGQETWSVLEASTGTPIIEAGAHKKRKDAIAAGAELLSKPEVQNVFAEAIASALPPSGPFVSSASTDAVDTGPSSDKGVRARIPVHFSNGQNQELSNLAYRPFTYQDRNYVSVEHAYQSNKMGELNEKIYSNPKWQTLAENKDKTVIVKDRRTPTDFTFSDNLMLQLMYSSFAQNKAAKAALLRTGDSAFSHNVKDAHWKTRFPYLLDRVRSLLRVENVVGLENLPENFQELVAEEQKVENKKEKLPSVLDSSPLRRRETLERLREMSNELFDVELAQRPESWLNVEEVLAEGVEDTSVSNEEFLKWVSDTVKGDEMFDLDSPTWADAAEFLLGADRLGDAMIMENLATFDSGKESEVESLSQAVQTLAFDYAQSLADSRQATGAFRGDLTERREFIRRAYMSLVRYLYRKDISPDMDMIKRDMDSVEPSAEEIEALAADLKESMSGLAGTSYNDSNPGEADETEAQDDLAILEEMLLENINNDGEKEKLKAAINDSMVAIARKFLDLYMGRPGSGIYTFVQALQFNPEVFVPPTVRSGVTAWQSYFLYSQETFEDFIDLDQAIVESWQPESQAVYRLMSSLTLGQARRVMTRLGAITLTPTLLLKKKEGVNGAVAVESMAINPAFTTLEYDLKQAIAKNLTLNAEKWFKQFEEMQQGIVNDRKKLRDAKLSNKEKSDIRKRLSNRRLDFFKELFNLDGIRENILKMANSGLNNDGLLSILEHNFESFAMANRDSFAPTKALEEVRASAKRVGENIIVQESEFRGMPESPRAMMLQVGAAGLPGVYASHPTLGRFEAFSLNSPLIQGLRAAGNKYRLVKIGGAETKPGGKAIKGMSVGPASRKRLMSQVRKVSRQISTMRIFRDKYNSLSAQLALAADPAQRAQLQQQAAIALAGLEQAKLEFYDQSSKGSIKQPLYNDIVHHILTPPGVQVFDDFQLEKFKGDKRAGQIFLSELGGLMAAEYPSGDKSSYYLVVGKPDYKDVSEEVEGNKLDVLYRRMREDIDSLVLGKDGYAAFRKLDPEKRGSEALDYIKRSGLYVSAGYVPIVTEEGPPPIMSAVTVKIPVDFGEADGGGFVPVIGASEQFAIAFGKSLDAVLLNMKGHIVGSLETDESGGVYKPMTVFIEHLKQKPLFAELIEYVEDFNNNRPVDKNGNPTVPPLYFVFDTGATKVGGKNKDNHVVELSTLRSNMRKKKAGDFQGPVIPVEDTYLVPLTDFRETTNVEATTVPGYFNDPTQNKAMEMFAQEELRDLMSKYQDLALDLAADAVEAGKFAALKEANSAWVRMLANSKENIDGDFVIWARTYHPIVAAKIRKLLRERIFGYKKTPELLPEAALTEEEAAMYNEKYQPDVPYKAGDFFEVLPGIRNNVVTDCGEFRAGDVGTTRAVRVRATIDGPGARYAIRVDNITKDQLKKEMKLIATASDLRSDEVRSTKLWAAMMKAQEEVRDAFPGLSIDYTTQRFHDMYAAKKGFRKFNQLREEELDEVVDANGNIGYVIPGSLGFMTRVPRGGLDAHSMIRMMTPYYNGKPFIAYHPSVVKRSGTDQDADSRKIEIAQYNRAGNLILKREAKKARRRADTMLKGELGYTRAQKQAKAVELAALTNQRFMTWANAFYETISKDKMLVLAGANEYDDIVINDEVDIFNEKGEAIGTKVVNVGNYAEGKFGNEETIPEITTELLAVEANLKMNAISFVAKLNSAVQTLVFGNLIEMDDFSEVVDQVYDALNLPKEARKKATEQEKVDALLTLYTNFVTQTIDAATHQNAEPMGLTPQLSTIVMTFALVAGEANDRAAAEAIAALVKHPLIKEYVALKSIMELDGPVRHKRYHEFFKEFFKKGEKYVSQQEQLENNLKNFIENNAKDLKQRQEWGAIFNFLFDKKTGIDKLGRDLFRGIRVADIGTGPKAPGTLADLLQRSNDIFLTKKALTLTSAGRTMTTMAERVVDFFSARVFKDSYLPATSFARTLIDYTERRRSKDGFTGGQVRRYNLEEYENVLAFISKVGMTEALTRSSSKVRSVFQTQGAAKGVTESILDALRYVTSYEQPKDNESARVWEAAGLFANSFGEKSDKSKTLGLFKDVEKDEADLGELTRAFVSDVSKGTWESPIMRILLQSDLVTNGGVTKFDNQLRVKLDKSGALAISVPTVVQDIVLTGSEAAKTMLSYFFSVYGDSYSPYSGSPYSIMIGPKLAAHLSSVFREEAKVWNSVTFLDYSDKEGMKAAMKRLEKFNPDIKAAAAGDFSFNKDATAYNPFTSAKRLFNTMNEMHQETIAAMYLSDGTAPAGQDSGGNDGTPTASLADVPMYDGLKQAMISTVRTMAIKAPRDDRNTMSRATYQKDVARDSDSNDLAPIQFTEGQKNFVDRIDEFYREELDLLEEVSSPETLSVLVQALEAKSKTVPSKYRFSAEDLDNFTGMALVATQTEGAPVGELAPGSKMESLAKRFEGKVSMVDLAHTGASLLAELHDPAASDILPTEKVAHRLTTSLMGVPGELQKILAPMSMFGNGINIGAEKMGRALQREMQRMNGYRQEHLLFANKIHKYLGLNRYNLIKKLVPGDLAASSLPFKNEGKLTPEEVRDIEALLWLTGAIRESAPVNKVFQDLEAELRALSASTQQDRAAQINVAQRTAFNKVVRILENTETITPNEALEEDGTAFLNKLQPVIWGREHKDASGNNVVGMETISQAFARLQGSSAVGKLRDAGRIINLDLLVGISFHNFALHSKMRLDFSDFIRRRDLYLDHRYGDGFLDGAALEAHQRLEDAVEAVSNKFEGEFFLNEEDYQTNFEDPQQQPTDRQQDYFDHILGLIVSTMQGESASKIRKVKARFERQARGKNRFEMNAVLGGMTIFYLKEKAREDESFSELDPETKKLIKTYKLLRTSVRGYKSKEWSSRQDARTRQGTYFQEFMRSGGKLKPKTLNVLALEQDYINDVTVTAVHRNTVKAMMMTLDEDGMPMVIALPSELADSKSLFDDSMYEVSARLISASLKKKYDGGKTAKENLEDLVRDHIRPKEGKEWIKHKSPFPSVALFYSQKGEATSWLKHITNTEKQIIKGGQDILHWAMRAVQWTKIQAVGWSIFFPMALMESVIAGTGIKDNIVFSPKKSGAMLKQMASELNQASGIYYDFANELNFVGFDLGHTGASDKPIGIVENDIAIVKKRVSRAWGAKAGETAERAFRIAAGKGLSDIFFGSWFPAMKVWAAHKMATQVAQRLGYADFEHVMDPVLRKQILMRIAPQINDAYGGQFWSRYPWANPRALQYLNLFMFAPNWTLSAWNIAGGGLLTGQLLNNTMSLQNSDFVFKTNWPAMGLFVLVGFPALMQASIWLTAMAFGNADDDDVPLPMLNEEGRKSYVDITPLIRSMPWYTGDPTGKRRYFIRFGKQSYEVLDGWLTEPVDQLLRKMSNPAKAIFEQVTGTSPGSNWNLEFSGMGFLGFVKGRDEDTVNAFINSRFGYLFQKVIPMSWSTLARNPETAIFNFIAPTSKGMSQGKAVGALVATLNTYADSEEWDKYKGNPKARLVLESLAPGILDAARRNGYDTDKILTSARGVVLGRLYKKFWSALDKEDVKRMDTLARGILRVGGTLRGLTTSMSNKASGYGRELSEAENKLIQDAFK